MDQELENKLYEKYPQLFSNKDAGVQASCMAWGCECGNGWYDIMLMPKGWDRGYSHNQLP